MGLFAYDSPLWRMTDRILRFLWLSILWMICCIPLFTMGASTAALYSVMLKYVKNNDGYMTSSFFKAFRENFKQGTIIWGIFTGIGALLAVGLVFYFRLQTPGIFSTIMMTAFFSLTVAFLLANMFVYALLANFENTLGRTMINAFVMALTHLSSGVLMLLCAVVILAAGTMVFPPLLIAAPALTAYINSRFFVKIFDRYITAAASREEAPV